MFDRKNITPQQVAAINAITIAFVGGVTNYIFLYNWLIALISFFGLLITSYLLTHYFIQRLIYRKIKLIYKFINQTKATKREEFYYKNILPQKSINEVRQDVEKWGIQKKKQIESLQQNEAYRKEFLQNLSHEIKTPVFAIQGYVDTLLNGALDKPEVNKKFLENAYRNVERLVNLIADLDEISKLESGEQLLHPTNFVVQDMIKEIYETLSIKAINKNINCFIKKGCETAISVNADKEKIRQVLINLVENAIKYGKNDGTVEASIYNTDGSNILIEISDDGYGIAEEHLHRIFERFYRTDYGRSRNIGGTGLGLSICKHIVEVHGHSLHVRSNIDVGSTFGFTLNKAK